MHLFRGVGDFALLILYVKFKKSIEKFSVLKIKGKNEPSSLANATTPPSFGRRFNKATFQIEKSAPVCGGSGGEADVGGNNSERFKLYSKA